MRAVGMRAHGGLERVEVLELPEHHPGPREVLVEVRACALNHLDVWVRKGWKSLQLKFPHVFGADVAGVVASLGPGADGWKHGDEVILQPGVSCRRCAACLSGRDHDCPEYQILGEHRSGGAAEFIAVPVENLMPKPPAWSWPEAAAFPLVFLTAWHMLVTRAAVRAGEWVLVQAAGSGVGSAAVQIARLFGAHVIATAGSEDKLDLARRLGAESALNYREADLAAQVKKLTGGRGVDVVFEHVGEATWDASLRALAPNGRLVICGATSGGDVRLDLKRLFWKRWSILGSTMGAKGELLEALAHAREGKLKPVVDRVFSFADAREAQRMLEDRAAFGKIVLVP
jgi:NADPH:quinone reductase-like Zn-dependent oxidoreductase